MNPEDEALERLDRALEALAQEEVATPDPERQLAAIRARLDPAAADSSSATVRRQVLLTAAAALLALFAGGWWLVERARELRPTEPRSVAVPDVPDVPNDAGGSDAPIERRPSPALAFTARFGALTLDEDRDALRNELDAFRVEYGLERRALGDLVRDGFDREDPAEQTAAVVCALALGPLEFGPLLEQASHRAPWSTAALEALAELDPRVLDRSLLDDRFPAALAMLVARADRGALHAIDAGLGRVDFAGDPERVDALLGGLVTFGEPGVSAITGQPGFLREVLRDRLRHVLRSELDERHVPGLIALLAESERRSDAALALARTGSSAALAELVRGLVREGREDLRSALALAVTEHAGAWSELAETSEPREAVELLEALVEVEGPGTELARIELAFRTELPIDLRLLAIQSLESGTDEALAEALRRCPGLPRSDRRLAAASVVQAGMRFGVPRVLDALGASGPGRERLESALADVNGQSSSGLVRVSRELASTVRFDELQLSFQP